MRRRAIRTLLDQFTQNPEETEAIGRQVARLLGPRPGDFLALQGSVGMGKSVFARGFIREATKLPDLKVLSPTFLLEQEYLAPSMGNMCIRHFDLYRFEPEMTEVDAKALDWYTALSNDACLVEWPERMKQAKLWPQVWTQVAFSTDLTKDSDGERRILVETMTCK